MNIDPWFAAGLPFQVSERETVSTAELSDGGPSEKFAGDLGGICRKATLANASAPYRVQNPQNREKEGFGVKKLALPITTEKGALSQKTPHFPCGAQ